MIKLRFYAADFFLPRYRIGPNPSNLPHIDLAVRDYIRSRRREVPGDPSTYPSARLPDINGYLIQITEQINANRSR